MNVSDAIALASLITGWLGSLAMLWWMLASQIRQVGSDLAKYKVEVERSLGERVTVERLDQRFARFEDRLDQIFAELRQLSPPSSRRG
jgi:hypothetical protein